MATCLHNKLIFTDSRHASCATCPAVIETGDGLCPKCRKPLDDSPHRLAEACR